MHFPSIRALSPLPFALHAAALVAVLASPACSAGGGDVAATSTQALASRGPSLPPGFQLGTAIAGFQVDMGCPTLAAAACEDRRSDWYQWITTKRILDNPLLHASRQPPSAAPGFYERYEDDLERAASELHGDATRLSIEWSRVFPEPTFGVTGFDALHAAASAQGLAYYHRIFAAMRARGLRPLVTVNHYTLPVWIHDGNACNQDLEHCKAKGWSDPGTIVPEIAKYAGFVAREFGGEVDQWATLNEPFSAVVLAGYVFPSADRVNPPGLYLHAAAAKRAARGLLDEDWSGHPVYREDLANRLDYLGVNYYFRLHAQANVLPVPGARLITPLLTFNPLGVAPDADPTGLYDAVKDAAKYGVPLIVTETGADQAKDAQAGARWIVRSLASLQRAMAEGVDVRGYFVWTLTDNYEWNHGMDLKFGLYAVDPRDPAKARVPRDSARVLGEIGAARAIPDAIMQTFGGP